MSEAARAELAGAGYDAVLEDREDTSALQAGAAFALFADRKGGVRVGADRAGKPRRSAESIGRYTARQLLAEIQAGACVDRFAADQMVVFTALAQGQSRLRIGHSTEHLMTALWLTRTFLGAQGRLDGCLLTVDGIGLRG